MSKKYLVSCPECGDELELDYFYEKGDVITCYGCDCELEIVSLKPLKFRVVKEDFEEKEEDDDSSFEMLEVFDEEEDWE